MARTGDDGSEQAEGSELRAFLFLTVVLAPVITVALVGGYGFVVWMLQLTSRAACNVVIHTELPSSPLSLALDACVQLLRSCRARRVVSETGTAGIFISSSSLG